MSTINTARVNIGRAKVGPPTSIVMFFDRANFYDAIADAGYDPLVNYSKVMICCSDFLEQATRPIEEFPEGDRDFIEKDREFWTNDWELQKMELLMQKCIHKI